MRYVGFLIMVMAINVAGAVEQGGQGQQTGSGWERHSKKILFDKLINTVSEFSNKVMDGLKEPQPDIVGNVKREMEIRRIEESLPQLEAYKKDLERQIKEVKVLQIRTNRHKDIYNKSSPSTASSIKKGKSIYEAAEEDSKELEAKAQKLTEDLKKVEENIKAAKEYKERLVKGKDIAPVSSKRTEIEKEPEEKSHAEREVNRLQGLIDTHERFIRDIKEDRRNRKDALEIKSRRNKKEKQEADKLRILYTRMDESRGSEVDSMKESEEKIKLAHEEIKKHQKTLAKYPDAKTLIKGEERNQETKRGQKAATTSKRYPVIEPALVGAMAEEERTIATKEFWKSDQSKFRELSLAEKLRNKVSEAHDLVLATQHHVKAKVKELGLLRGE